MADSQVNSNVLFFIEGGGQLAFEMCWGDGYVNDEALISSFGLSDPNPFFQTLLTKPYLDNMVIAPHYYGPSISGQTFKCDLLGITTPSCMLYCQEIIICLFILGLQTLRP